MFIIMQSWRNLAGRGKTDGETLEWRFGMTMENAGVAITITSITDFLAFVVGGTTVSKSGQNRCQGSSKLPLNVIPQVLPALRSFCIFCGVGILIVYFLQSTWFVAWMVLDQVTRARLA